MECRNGSDNSTDPSDRYFLPDKAFTANPLEGTWSDTENGMVLHIKSDGVMEITQALEAETVTIPVEYSMDRNTKGLRFI